MGKYLVVESGDIVFNKLRTWQGGLGASEYKGIVSPAYFVCRPRPDFSSKFLQYLLLSAPYLQELTRVSKWQPPSQFDITWEQLRQVPIVAPGLSAQQAIADYLDAETARIDALIEKKQRMIGLIDDRFSDEVDTRIDGSGAPFVRLRWCVERIADGTHGTYERLGEGMPLLSSKNLKNGSVVSGENEAWISVSDYEGIIKSCQFRHGDILLGVIGGSIGNVSRLPIGSPLAFQRSVAALRPGARVCADFLFFVCRSRRFQDELLLAANTSAQAGVYLGSLGDIRIPFPPLEVQEEIARKLSQSYPRALHLKDGLTEQIVLLRERRSTLITAAVTGELEIEGVAA